MKLIKLSITNFRGIAELLIDAQGHNVKISGENGLGKTTVFDSFLWLLFGKDSADRKDYDLKPHDVDGVPITGQGLEPTVEGVLDCNGNQITLKKVYAEQWPKNRDTKVKEYAGSKVIYYVNELEVKAGDYQKAVSDLISEDVFKLITNPHYFSETLSWQDRRATLVKIVGELNVPISKELLDLMAGRPFEDFYALCKQQSKEKAQKIDAMPAVINEARRNIPQVEGNAETISAEIEDLKAKKQGLETDLSNLKNDTAMNQKRRDIANLETEIVRKRATYEQGVESENRSIKAGITQLESEVTKKRQEIFELKSAASTFQIHNSNMAVSGKGLQEEKELIESRAWDGKTICPTCNRELPAEQVEKALAEFNTNRSNRLEEIRAQGEKINADYLENQNQITDQQAKIATLNAEISALETRITDEKLRLKTPDFENTDDYKALSDKLNALRERIKGSAANNKQDKIDAIQSGIDALQENIEGKSKLISQLENKATQEKHVVELMAQEKSLNAELENVQHSIHLCEQYVKAKTKALEQAVNGKFKVVRFQLFETQKNGEEAECCNVIYPNGSTNLSKGQKAHAGLDIIRTLSEFYGVSAPIFFDDAGEITIPLETDAQLIRLFAVVGEKKLKVEVL